MGRNTVGAGVGATSDVEEGASSGYESAGASCVCFKHVEAPNGNNSSVGNSGVRGSSVVGHDMASVLRDGRIQALVEGLWTKVVSGDVDCGCVCASIVCVLVYLWLHGNKVFFPFVFGCTCVDLSSTYHICVLSSHDTDYRRMRT